MQFNFKDVGPIKSASIALDGLTVITGLNDTGKSFISKSIYSILKTLKDSNQEASIMISDELDRILRPLSILSRDNEIKSLDQILFALRFELTRSIRRGSKERISSLLEDIKGQLMEEIASNPAIKGYNQDNVNSLFQSIDELISTDIDPESVRKSHFDRTAISQLFKKQFNSLGSPEKAEIICEEKGVPMIDIAVKNNKVQHFISKDVLPVNDATIIDSPIILQFSFFIRQNRVRPSFHRNRDAESLPSYYLDLLTKLPSVQAPIDLFSPGFDSQEYDSIIKDIIGGKMIYREKKDSFVFEKSNGNEIELNNIASGIKSFGIIQLLLASGYISPSSIILIDEPEVHLHPMWEIEYARIIIKLVKAGIPIVISSHSPYFIRALASFSKKEDINHKIKFYFGERVGEKKESVFNDVTENLDVIFAKLAKPMEQLMLNDL